MSGAPDDCFDFEKSFVEYLNVVDCKCADEKLTKW